MIEERQTFLKKIELEEFDLPNKLHCILHRENSKPIINILIGYKVGSKDEPGHKKGIAHLFEHLMFQGSKNIKKNKHFSIVQNAGGLCNAFTMQDVTTYFNSLPSNHLETVLWLESDRMISLDFTNENLDNQKKVVIEEKHTRVDNAPYGTVYINIFKEVYKHSPYESGVIGNEDDIKSFTNHEAELFHSKYYSPGNSILVLSGDINYKTAREQITKYFGGIEKENRIQRPDKNFRTIQNEKRFTFYDNITLPGLYICYLIPKAGTKEEFTLEYFASIIANNKSSRLHKKLVYEKKLIKSIHALKYQLEDVGIFIFDVLVFPDTDLRLVENEIYNEVNEFATKGINKKEFEKVRNEIEFDNTSKYVSIQNINLEILFDWMYFRDTDLVNKKLGKYLSVEIDDVVNSVKKYFMNTGKVVVTYLPKDKKK